MAFKRKRVMAVRPRATWGIKKGKFARRRRGGKSNSYSTRSSGASGFGYRNRKVSGRAFRRNLFNSTKFSTHWRSVGGVLNTTGSPASAVLSRSIVYNAIDNGVTSSFWLATGGAIDVNGATLPIFRGDIVMRGGVVGAHINNTDATGTDILNVKLMLGIAPDIPNTSGFNSATRPIGWDVTMFPEFSNFVMKSVLKTWDFVLKPQEQMTVKYRMGVRKIDKQEWIASGQRPYWIVILNGPANNNVTDCNFTTFFSLSFTGDAVGTT